MTPTEGRSAPLAEHAAKTGRRAHGNIAAAFSVKTAGVDESLTFDRRRFRKRRTMLHPQVVEGDVVVIPTASDGGPRRASAWSKRAI